MPITEQDSRMEVAATTVERALRNLESDTERRVVVAEALRKFGITQVRSTDARIAHAEWMNRRRMRYLEAMRRVEGAKP